MDQETIDLIINAEQPPTLFDYLLRFPEPERSLAIAKYHEFDTLVSESAKQRSAPPTLKSKPQILYVQMIKDYRVGNKTVSIRGIYPVASIADEDRTIKEVRSSMTMNPKVFLPTCKWILWESKVPKGSLYVTDSFTCTGIVLKEPPKHCIYLHTSPPQMGYIRDDGAIQIGIPSQGN